VFAYLRRRRNERVLKKSLKSSLIPS